MTDYELSERQASAVLELRLYQLTGLERDKIESEYNQLLDKISHFLAVVAGMEVPRYLDTLEHSYGNLPPVIFSQTLQEEAFKQDLMQRNGVENVHQLHEELSDVLVKYVTVKRNNEDLTKAIDIIKEIRERYQNICLDDKGIVLNQTYVFANQYLKKK